MKPQRRNHPSPVREPDAASGVRPGVKWAVVAIVALSVVFAWHPWRPSPAPAGANESAGSAPTKPADANPKAARASKPAPLPLRSQAGVSAPALTPVASQPAGSAPVDPALGALVAGLRNLSGTNAALTFETVSAWRTNFVQLVQAGPAAIPALQAFLNQKADDTFSREVWQALGYGSPRLAALDALRQIGGPEATVVMEAVLGKTTSPREIAVLARNLEEASPGQYREQALAAARAGLTAAATGKDQQVDVAPLFEVFSHYGNAAVISELEKAADQWKYYATIALANLPEGAGLPSLLKMAEPTSGSGNRVVALEMIAQMAVDNPAARQFLLAQVSGNSISPNLWPYLASPLTGNQYFPVDSAITQYPGLQSISDLKTTSIKFGNQNLYSLPGSVSLTANGISQRVALVDELMKATSDAAAVQALQQIRETLVTRSARATTQPAAAGTGN